MRTLLTTVWYFSPETQSVDILVILAVVGYATTGDAMQ
jgi:hypothetical protein